MRHDNMNKILIIFIIILSITVLTNLAFAHPVQGQRPSHYNNYSAPQNNTPYASRWNNNYVNRNYNPYRYQEQVGFNIRQQQNVQFSPANFPIQFLPQYGNPFFNFMPMTLAPPLMPFNPWFQAYGVTPAITLPRLRY